jgi:hypothetical protein
VAAEELNEPRCGLNECPHSLKGPQTGLGDLEMGGLCQLRASPHQKPRLFSAVEEVMIELVEGNAESLVEIAEEPFSFVIP